MQQKETQRSYALSRRDAFRLASATGLGALAGSLIDQKVSQSIDPWEKPLAENETQGKRFLLIADVHAGDFNNGDRQACGESIHTLQSVVDHLQGFHFDEIIQLGDLIQDQGTQDMNILRYETCVSILDQLGIPSIHLLGNHDLWGISKEDITTLFRRNTLNEFHGVKAFNDIQIVWLGLDAEKNVHGSLPEEQIEWLRHTIYKDTPTFIFSHYSLLQHDVTDSYYFRGDKRMTALANGETVWNALAGLPIKAVVSAHLHMGAHVLVDSTHMITIPAFVENIVSTDPRQNPGVYSILDITSPNEFSVRSFYGSNCIFKIQVK